MGYARRHTFGRAPYRSVVVAHFQKMVAGCQPPNACTLFHCHIAANQSAVWGVRTGGLNMRCAQILQGSSMKRVERYARGIVAAMMGTDTRSPNSMGLVFEKDHPTE